MTKFHVKKYLHKSFWETQVKENAWHKILPQDSRPDVVAQWMECFSSEHEALDWSPPTT